MYNHADYLEEWPRVQGPLGLDRRSEHSFCFLVTLLVTWGSTAAIRVLVFFPLRADALLPVDFLRGGSGGVGGMGSMKGVGTGYISSSSASEAVVVDVDGVATLTDEDLGGGGGGGVRVKLPKIF